MTDESLPPIHTEHLFREICKHLAELLRSLNDEEWELPTTSSRRHVKDIASHLLDGSLRRLSMQRDRYFPMDNSSHPGPTESLQSFLNRLNDEWEVGTRRLSPTVLIGLIEWADDQLVELFESLNPTGPAIFSVAWAGEEQSQNWMDVARDFTEKWHHTQQIFEATGRASTITEYRLFHPCLDTFMRALPFTFRDVEATVGATVSVTVTGQAGGRWYLQFDGLRWRQVVAATDDVLSNVVLDQMTFWKMVTKRRSREATISQFPDIRIEGDLPLGSHVLDMVSMMA